MAPGHGEQSMVGWRSWPMANCFLLGEGESARQGPARGLCSSWPPPEAVTASLSLPPSLRLLFSSSPQVGKQPPLEQALFVCVPLPVSCSIPGRGGKKKPSLDFRSQPRGGEEEEGRSRRKGFCRKSSLRSWNPSWDALRWARSPLAAPQGSAAAAALPAGSIPDGGSAGRCRRGWGQGGGRQSPAMPGGVGSQRAPAGPLPGPGVS